MGKLKVKISLAMLFIVVIGLLWGSWNHYASPTRVALVNFQPYMATSLKLSNTDSHIKVEDVPLEKLNKLGNYDFVLGFGMGMRLTAEQRAQIEAASAKTNILIYGATTPENKICNLDSLQQKTIEDYFANGNKHNYQSMVRYIRQTIDRKKLFVTAPDSVVESASDVLYHIDDTQAFATVAEYESYLKKNGFYKEGAPRVAMVCGMNDPFSGNRDNIDSIIVSFERAGMNIYPVSSSLKRLDFLKEIQPNAVIYFAHGRMSMMQPDAAVEWLKAQNIPLFAPLSVLQNRTEWEADPMGMFGGFMSQSVVMPELDGAIYPYVITAPEVDENGLYRFKAIHDRLNSFTQIVKNFISLKNTANANKRVAIFYFKGAGQEALAAQGLETVPSLFNLLKRLKDEGYKVENLPADVKAFEKLLMQQGAVLSTYAEGVFDNYLKNGNPQLVSKADYESWAEQSMPKKLYADVTSIHGEAPGSYMAVEKNGQQYLAIARIELGNIVLLPQPMAALGDDAFAIVHGAKSAPPHTYIAPYLWTRFGFKADAILHFGTHGSLEFTPQKQVALSSYDWPDRLTGIVPHFYYYTIGNIGESVMAKRRSYATAISYLTPPFMESNTRTQFKTLHDKIRAYYKATESAQNQASIEVKKLAVSMGLHRDLRLDSITKNPWTPEEIERIENFAEEISTEKMNGELYTTGVSYSSEKIFSTVMAISADPIAYSLAALDKQRGKVTDEQLKNRAYFNQRYLEPAKTLASQILNGKPVSEELVCTIGNLSATDLAKANEILMPKKRSMGPVSESKDSSSVQKEPAHSENTKEGHPAWIPKIGKRPDSSKTASANHGQKTSDSTAQKPDAKTGATQVKKEYTKEDKAWARVVTELERSVLNVVNYKHSLEQSPELEMQSIVNALSGGYVAPGPGGDAVANPNALPTGRNLYSINAEATPSEAAWEKGIEMAKATLEQYQKQHGDYPRKVSYTFWSSEFIESEGATIAQVLYMLGVEPVRDTYGRVSDLQLIDSKTLGRPRIDVVVQTSGQFRDIAASRLAYITRAVEMAAAAGNEPFENRVAQSTVETERLLVEQGVSPKNARELSTQRVFGGINGMYGTNIQGMITGSDKWESEKEIADTYINNMGAVYGSDKNWGQFSEGLLRAVLHNTDVIVQPRQSNTWGALSLDHVYEFMGGMNLAIRNVTGKDPDAYFADYRNRNNYRVQDLKEAIGVEARATVFNPAYIKEVMKGGESSAAQNKEVATNTFGWNVAKPAVIDNEMWDEFYNVYVKDKFNLGTQAYFERENQGAMQEITAIMLEASRKGMWQATDAQLSDLAKVHATLVEKFGSVGSGFAGGNKKLQQFIAQKVDKAQASSYKKELEKMNTSAQNGDVKNGKVLKKQELNGSAKTDKNPLNGLWIVSLTLLAFVLVLLALRKKRKK
jgi:cobaltochelatase CobN